MSLLKSAAGFTGKLPYTAAVVVAAGSASRMGGIDKILAPLGAEPVIVHSVRALQQSACIHEIVVVTREELIVEVSRVLQAAGLDKVSAVVAGGATRSESVMLGLDQVNKKTKYAAIHDGARPFVTVDIIDRTVRAAINSGAAAPAIAVKDTIKTAESGIVTGTPNRSSLFAVQTPQVFDFDLLRGALVKARLDQLELTDDCSAVEHLGMSVRLTVGSEENIKITTPMDLAIGQVILERREV